MGFGTRCACKGLTFVFRGTRFARFSIKSECVWFANRFLFWSPAILLSILAGRLLRQRCPMVR